MLCVATTLILAVERLPVVNGIVNTSRNRRQRQYYPPCSTSSDQSHRRGAARNIPPGKVVTCNSPIPPRMPQTRFFSGRGASSREERRPGARARLAHSLRKRAGPAKRQRRNGIITLIDTNACPLVAARHSAAAPLGLDRGGVSIGMSRSCGHGKSGWLQNTADRYTTTQ